jgi:cytochrome c biogenesis protein
LKALLDPFQAVVRKQFRYQRVETAERTTCIYAERGRWTRLGVYVVHLSIVLLIIGAMVGSFFGFEGFVNLPEGEGTDTIRLRNNPAMGLRLPFEIHCDDFNMEVYSNGAPKEFRSDLRLVKEGQTVYAKEIIVNDPIRFEGINIFQSSYGELPPDHPSQPAPVDGAPPESFDLKMTSKRSGMTYDRKLRVGETLALPEGLGDFTLEAYLPDMEFGGQKLGPAIKGLLTPKEGETAEVLVPLKFPNFDKMRQGDVVIAVAGTMTEKFSPQGPAQKRYYTGLQVTRDPGVTIVYTAFIMMILGCVITFFMSHRQLCVEIAPGGSVRVAGVANKNPLGLERQIEQLAERLQASVKEP